jgi:REP element-mobilizing transposase RayT
MPHTYTSLLVHCVFSTKDRRPIISEEVQPRLWAYMGGIARTNRIKALAISGMNDHAHVLLSLSAAISVAKAMQLIKAGSSKWMHDEVKQRLFSWQESYGAFSIGVSQLRATINYIDNQKKHHKRRSFEEEFAMILKRTGSSRSNQSSLAGLESFNAPYPALTCRATLGRP